MEETGSLTPSLHSLHIFPSSFVSVLYVWFLIFTVLPVFPSVLLNYSSSHRPSFVLPDSFVPASPSLALSLSFSTDCPHIHLFMLACSLIATAGLLPGAQQRTAWPVTWKKPWNQHPRAHTCSAPATGVVTMSAAELAVSVRVRPFYAPYSKLTCSCESFFFTSKVMSDSLDGNDACHQL